MAGQFGDDHNGPTAPEYDLTVRVGDVVRSSSDPVSSRWKRWSYPISATILLLLVAAVIVFILIGTR